MGRLKEGTIKERWEAMHAERTKAGGIDVVAEQAASKARTKAWDADNLLPVSLRPRCRWCGSTLRPYRWRAYPHAKGKAYGDYGDGLFCGLRCGYHYGERAAKGRTK